jgi:hypothetical protein
MRYRPSLLWKPCPAFNFQSMVFHFGCSAELAIERVQMGINGYFLAFGYETGKNG